MSAIIKSLPGIFFACTAENPAMTIPIAPMSAGTITFSTKVGGHGSPFDSMFGMRSDGDPRHNLVAGVIVRADRNRFIVDLNGSDVKSDVDGKWFVTGGNYSWTITRGSGNVSVSVKTAGAVATKSVSGSLGHDYSVTRLNFSIPGVGDGAYFPCIGWEYSDLIVTADDVAATVPVPPSGPSVTKQQIKDVLAYLTLQNS